MVSVKQVVTLLLERLPEDCSFEDIHYHLQVIGKVRRGLERGDKESAIEQDEAEARLAKRSSISLVEFPAAVCSTRAPIRCIFPRANVPCPGGQTITNRRLTNAAGRSG
jgi:hypothetical protein